MFSYLLSQRHWGWLNRCIGCLERRHLECRSAHRSGHWRSRRGQRSCRILCNGLGRLKHWCRTKLQLLDPMLPSPCYLHTPHWRGPMWAYTALPEERQEVYLVCNFFLTWKSLILNAVFLLFCRVAIWSHLFGQDELRSLALDTLHCLLWWQRCSSDHTAGQWRYNWRSLWYSCAQRHLLSWRGRCSLELGDQEPSLRSGC